MRFMANICKFLVLTLYLMALPFNVSASELSGRLLYQGPENSLVELDLHTLKSKTILTNLPFTTNDGILKGNENNVIVSVGSKLIVMNINSGDTKIIGEAYSAQAYLQKSDTLFYLYGRNSRLGLFEAKAKDISNTAQQIGTEVTSGYIGVVPISDHEIIFSSTEHQGKLWHYDVSDKKLILVDAVENCWPVAFRRTDNQVVCATSQRGRYSLVSIQGERHELADFPSSGSPLIYLDKDDVMLYTKASWWPLLGEYRDLYAYDFKTGKSIFLKENMGLPAGLVVYFE